MRRTVKARVHALNQITAVLINAERWEQIGSKIRTLPGRVTCPSLL